MNKFLVGFMMILSLGATSRADELPSPPPSSHHEGPCSKFKLDDGQKAQMKEAWFKFEEEKIDLQTQVEKSRLKYKKLMSDPSTEYKTAKAASRELSENIAKMISAKESFKTKVAFEILKPEQRELGQMCDEHMKHGGHHHGHGHFGDEERD